MPITQNPFDVGASGEAARETARETETRCVCCGQPMVYDARGYPSGELPPCIDCGDHYPADDLDRREHRAADHLMIAEETLAKARKLAADRDRAYREARRETASALGSRDRSRGDSARVWRIAQGSNAAAAIRAVAADELGAGWVAMLNAQVRKLEEDELVESRRLGGR